MTYVYEFEAGRVLRGMFAGLVLAGLLGCEGTQRESSHPNGPSSSQGDVDDNTQSPMATSTEPGSGGTGSNAESSNVVTQLQPASGAAEQASAPDTAPVECVEGTTESCGPPREEGICKFGTRTCAGGAWGECSGAVLAGSRDCASAEDNDCDGQPDDTLDDVCRCPAEGSRPCEEHDGLDGNGQCHAGQQPCVLGEGNLTSDWGTCDGFVGPGTADSCSTAGDDSNCDGVPNGGCSCVEGTMLPCGPDTDTGSCQRGVSTCQNGAFSTCEGATLRGRRDCSSAQDNDCDGRPDNTLDTSCACVIGTVQACGTHPGRDGVGPCRAGSQVCVAGNQGATSNFDTCSGALGPDQRDSCTVFGDDADCNGAPNSGCQCVAGRGNLPCAGDPNNARCNAQGQCAPCQGNADCSLVSGGRNLCTGGVCTAPRCGDGAVQPEQGEECDDGGTANGDGCSNTCQITRTPHGSVSFGAYSMCTPLVSGRLVCWGSNAYGQLGTGDKSDSATPLPVLSINSAVEVALSDIATCARLSNNTVSCWGTNDAGNLGLVTATDSTSPVLVPNLTNAVQLAGGGSGFCAVRSNGGVACWGDTSPSQGGVTDKNLSGIIQIAGGNLHFCGVRADGTVACWGSNLAGQFGNGRQASNDPTPVETSLTNVAEVAAGGDTTCVRLRSGAVSCFGRGGGGQLGNNASVDSLVPVTVSGGLNNAVKLAGAEDHFCALTSTQTVRCWGANLGGGGDDAPTTFTLPSNAVDIGAGADASCALLDDNSLRCWGAGFAGQLGTGVLLNAGSATPLRPLNIP